MKRSVEYNRRQINVLTNTVDEGQLPIAHVSGVTFDVHQCRELYSELGSPQ